jgi:hypothetical protein
MGSVLSLSPYIANASGRSKGKYGWTGIATMLALHHTAKLGRIGDLEEI